MSELRDARAGDAARTVVLAADPLLAARELLPGRTLLAPNPRAARAVRGVGVARGLHDRAARAVSRQGASLAGPMARLLALREVVAEVLAPADVAGTSRRVEPVVSELLRSGIASRAGLIAALEGAPGVGRRSAAVARLALAYRRRLEERGAVDPAELLWRAAAAPLEREVVLVSGYARLGDGEVAFLDALAAAGSAVVLPRGFASSEAASEELAARGWSVVEDVSVGDAPGPLMAAAFTAAVGDARRMSGPDHGPAATAGSAPGPGTPSVTARRLADEEDEVRFVLASIKRLLAYGARPDAVVMVARDDRGYGPLVKAVAAEFDVPVRLAYAVPLRETRLGEAVSLLVEAVGGRLPFEPTAKLLRHPLTRALPDEAWAAARTGHATGAAEWQAAGAERAALLDWPGRASWGDYRERLTHALEGLGLAAPTGQRDRRAHARLLRALRDALPPAGSAPEREVVPLGAFLGLLSDVLDAATMPADPPGRGAVELHTPLAVFGARYDHVFVLGLSEGAFPEAVADDPVIDFHERRALARAGLELEDAEGAAEREELSFLAVLHACGASLTLTCPESSGGKERLPSPFFAAVGVGEPEPAEPRTPASRLEGLIATLEKADGRARYAWSVERRREGGEPPDAHDGVHGVPLPVAGSYSATQLIAFGQCSFRWFVQYGLRLHELEEAEEDVSPLTIGSIFHATLMLAVMRAKEEAPACGETPENDPFRAAVLDHLERAYDEANAQRGEGDRRVRSLTWPLRRGDNLETLARLVRSPDFALPGARVLAVEQRFRSTWRGLTVTGAVDRIDAVTVDGRDHLVLTDYKFGSSVPPGAKSADGKLTLDVQLPLYVEAAAPALFPGVPVREARYLSINAAKVKARVVPEEIDSAALDGLVARFREALAAGSFPLDPDVELAACRYCDYDVVCRRGPRLSRKRGADGGEPAGEVAA